MKLISHGSILAVFFSANLAERQEGLQWYGRADAIARDLADQYLNGDYYVSAAVIAALSPNNRWERNIVDAEALIKTFTLGGDYDALKVCTFSSNKAKAIAILKGEPPLDVLKGRKVRSFYQCIIGQDDVCIDGHAYAIWLGQHVPTTKTPKISDKLYNQISDDYRIAAKQIYEITGCYYRACQVQAITWIAWRNLDKSTNGAK